PTISAARPTPRTLVSLVTSSIVPRGSSIVPATRTILGPSAASWSASASASRTSTIFPPRPPVVPAAAPSPGTPAKPVAVGDHTGEAVVPCPVGTRIRCSSSVSSPPPGSAAAGASGASEAAEAAPRAVVNWRRDRKVMVILVLCVAGLQRVGRAGGGGRSALHGSDQGALDEVALDEGIDREHG